MPSTAFAAPFRVPQLGRLEACIRPHRLLSSLAGKTLCFAPIRATRQSTEALRESSNKFPFVDTFKLSSGEAFSSAEVIAGLAPLATSKRLAVLDKVCFDAAVVLPAQIRPLQILHELARVACEL